jgi:hypothetical protein
MYEMLLGQSPFRGDDEDEIFDAILEDEPLYPITMPRDAVSILQKVSFSFLCLGGATDCPRFAAPYSRSQPPAWFRKGGRGGDQEAAILQGRELGRCIQQAYTPSVLPHDCKSPFLPSSQAVR